MPTKPQVTVTLREYQSKAPLTLITKVAQTPVVLRKGDLLSLGLTEVSIGKVKFSITPAIYTQLLSKTKNVQNVVLDELGHDPYPELSKILQQKLLTVSKAIQWKFDPKMVKWLRYTKQLEKLWEKDKLKGINKMLLWLNTVPVQKSVRKGSNKTAIVMAERLLRTSVPSICKNAAIWCKNEDGTYSASLDMIQMYFSDCSDHLELAIALYQGNLSRAYKVSSMDTASRDQIPSSVWEYLMSLNAK